MRTRGCGTAETGATGGRVLRMPPVRERVRALPALVLAALVLVLSLTCVPALRAQADPSDQPSPSPSALESSLEAERDGLAHVTPESGEPAIELWIDKGDITLLDGVAEGFDAQGAAVRREGAATVVVRQADPKAPATHRVTVSSGARRLELRDVHTAPGGPLLDVRAGASATVVLSGSSTAEGTESHAALHVAPGAHLSFAPEGTGRVEVASSGAGAAVGGDGSEGSGSVTVAGGSVVAHANGGGAAVGGGAGAANGPVLVCGGSLEARLGGGVRITSAVGAGGSSRDGGPITVTGGELVAAGGWGGLGVGGMGLSGASADASLVRLSGGRTSVTGGFQGNALEVGTLLVQGDAQLEVTCGSRGEGIRARRVAFSGGTTLARNDNWAVVCAAVHADELVAVLGGRVRVEATGPTSVGVVGPLALSGGRLCVDASKGGAPAVCGGPVSVTGGALDVLGGRWSAALGSGGELWGAPYPEASGPVPVVVEGGSLRAVAGEGCSFAIGNGTYDYGAPLWPTNGSARVYEHVVEGISDVATLVVDGRPASELGVDSQNDDGRVHLWLTAGTHSVRVDGRDETFEVKDSYALVAAGTSAPTSGPHAAGERVALEARRPDDGYAFGLWRWAVDEDAQKAGLMGDQAFSDVLSARTELTMPACDLVVSAGYVRAVSEIVVSSPPAKMEYVEGDAFSVEGMALTLRYTDGREEVVSAGDFAARGIGTTPPDGAILSREQDGSKVELRYGDWRASTDAALSVSPLVVEGEELAVRVQDGGGAGPLPDVTVRAMDEGGNVAGEATTGEDGLARLTLPAGTWRVCAARPGYYLRTTELRLEEGGGPRELTIPLNAYDSVSGSVTATPMSAEEARKAGIDLDAIGNQHVFRFKATLEFVAAEGIEPSGKGSSSVGVSFIGTEDGTVVGSSTTHATINGRRATVHALSERFYLVIYGDVHWLKELFDVELVVLNNSVMETISPCEADLALPKGLSLADVTGSPQEKTAHLGDIAPKKTATAHWFVRGDEEGAYDIGALVSGSFRSEGVDPQPFSQAFETTSPVSVMAGGALHLYIVAESGARQGGPYRVLFRLRNMSDRPIYNLSLALPREHQYRVSTQDGRTGISTFVQRGRDDMAEWDVLSPGEICGLNFETTIWFQSKIWDDPEYVLVGMFLDMLDGSTTRIPYSFSTMGSLGPDATVSDNEDHRYGFGEGDPVDLLTGEFSWEETDLSLRGKSGVSYARYYRSPKLGVAHRDGDQGPADAGGAAGRLGEGWSDSFDYGLTIGGGLADATLPGGMHACFTGDDEAGYTPLFGARYRLRREGEGHVLTLPGGTELSFDARGRALVARGKNGLSLSFAYEEGRLSSVTSPAGSVSLSYGEGGRLSGVSDSAGRSVSYGWEGGRLSSVTNADGNTMTLSWDGSGLLSRMSDYDASALIENRYDDRGRVTSQWSKSTGTTGISYDAEGRTNSATDALGHKSSVTYDAEGRIVKGVSDGHERTVSYDERGFRSSETDWLGNVTRYECDARGNVTARHLPDGTVERLGWDKENRLTSSTSAGGATTTYAWSEAGDLASVTDPLGNVTSYGYDGDHNRTSVTDALGNVTRLGWDEAGRLASVTDASGARATIGYDGAGRVATLTDGLGNVTGYEYLPGGALARRVDASGGAWAFEYDASGRRTKATAPDGTSTLWAYDEAGRPATQTDAAGNETRLEWDALGGLAGVTDAAGNRVAYTCDSDGNVTSVTDALGNVRSLERDDNGRPVRSTDARGNATTYSWDPCGRLLEVTDADGTARAEYDADGRPVRVTDRTGAQTSYAWDAAGRLASVTDALGNVTSYERDALGQPTVVVDPLGAATRYSWDPCGRPLGVEGPTGEATSYVWDAAGRLERMRDATGETTLSHDALGDLTELTWPDGTSERWERDALGRPLSATDRAGAVTRYSWDAVGDLVRVTDPLGGQTSYGHDALGNVTSLTDAGGVTRRWSYDGRGLVSSASDALGNVTSYSWDAEGNLASERDPDGRTVTWERDAAGRPVAVTGSGGVHDRYSWDAEGALTSMEGEGGTTSFGRDALGRITSTRYPGGEVASCAWDACGRRESLTYPDGTVARWSWDAAGRLVGVDDDGRATSYAYDAAGRLASTRTPDGWREDYGYDAAGLMASRVTTTADGGRHEASWAYDAAGRLTSRREQGVAEGDPGASGDYAYDACGRLISASDASGERTYAWDAAGRLARERTGAGETSYSWDAAGRLASKAGPGGREDYSWDGRGDMVLSRFLKDGRVGFTSWSYDGLGRPAMALGTEGAGRWSRDPVGAVCAGSGGEVLRDYASPGLEALVRRGPDGASERSAWGLSRVGVTASDGRALVPHTDWLGTERAWGSAADGSAAGWASLDEWGAELPGGRDAGVGGLWAGLEGLSGPEGGWSAGPRAYSPGSRAFLSPDPEAPDASDPATAAAYAYANGSPLSMVDPSGGRATPAQGGWDEQSWRATQARRAVAAGARDVAEFAGILDRHTESYSELVCGVIARGQRTTYTVNPHGVLNVAGMIPGPVGFAADVANTGLYIWEGDWAGAGMSAAPRVFDAIRAGRAASSSTRFASRGDDMARAATRGEGFASRTWSRAKSAFRSFRDEVGDFAREVAGSESGAATPRFALPFGEDVARAAKKLGRGLKAKATGKGAARSSGPRFKKDEEAWESLKKLMKDNDDINYRKINERSYGCAVYERVGHGPYPRYITRDRKGHRGGAWKGAQTIKDILGKATRAGTYDEQLRRIGE